MPHLLKLTGDDHKTRSEFGMHSLCQSIPDVVTPVELIEMDRGGCAEVGQGEPAPSRFSISQLQCKLAQDLDALLMPF